MHNIVSFFVPVSVIGVFTFPGATVIISSWSFPEAYIFVHISWPAARQIFQLFGTTLTARFKFPHVVVASGVWFRCFFILVVSRLFSFRAVQAPQCASPQIMPTVLFSCESSKSLSG